MDQRWHHDEQNLRESDVPENLQFVGAIDPCRLDLISRQVLDDPRRNQHRCRNTDPHIDDNDRNFCPNRIRQKRNGGIDQAQAQQRCVDGTRAIQQIAHHQQRDELRHCHRDDENRAPNAFEFQAFGVDQKRQQDAEEKASDRRQRRPDQRPAQDREEGVCHISGNDVTEVHQADPSKEVFRRQMRVVIVREGDRNHVKQRQDREQQYAQQRNRHQGSVEAFVQQTSPNHPSCSESFCPLASAHGYAARFSD